MNGTEIILWGEKIFIPYGERRPSDRYLFELAVQVYRQRKGWHEESEATNG